MQPAVLRALEFDRIRETLAFQTLTPLGRAAALAGQPLDPLSLVGLAMFVDSVDLRVVHGHGTGRLREAMTWS